MPRKQPAQAAFDALHIPPEDYTPAMKLAISQRWSDLPTTEKVDVLRKQVADVNPAPVPTLEQLIKEAAAEARALDPSLDKEAVAAIATKAAKGEHSRLKRNAAVNAWRRRNQLQAALDARELRFAAMRAKKTGAAGKQALAGAA